VAVVATLVFPTAMTAAGQVADRKPPSVPDDQRVTRVTRTAVTMAWSAARDNVGVAGYRIYLGNRRIATTTRRSFTYRGLRCGRRYVVGLTAFDHAGNASALRFARGAVRTRRCASAAPPAPPPAPPETPASVFLAPNGADGNPCTRARPCASFQKGYDVAAPGAVVELAAGSYTSTSLNGASKVGGRVVFRPAVGAGVTVSREIRTNGVDHVEFQGMAIPAGIYISGSPSNSSDDITFRGASIRTLFVRNSNGFNLIGGDVGGTCDGTSATIGSGSRAYRVRNVLIEGVRFHDITRGCDAGAHVECLFIQETSGLTMRNTTFTNCGVLDVYLNAIGGGGDPDGVIFEGNSFGRTDGGFYTMETGDSEIRLIRNRFGQGIVAGPRTTGCGNQVISGRFPAPLLKAC
jgi:hypothetical protein